MNGNNHPSQQDWVEVTGAFLMNFGAIEMIVINSIYRLTTDEILKDVAIDLPISKRLKIVCDLIKQSSFPADQKQRALELFGRVGSLLAIRNNIAHGPLSTDKVTKQRGFIDIKELKGPKPHKLNLVGFMDVATAGRETAKILDEFVEIGWWDKVPNA